MLRTAPSMLSLSRLHRRLLVRSTRSVYIGHNCIGHNCIGHDCLGHTYIGAFDAIRRSYSRSSMRPLGSGAHLVEFMLEPVAYEVRANHLLRLALAGTDNDNFLLDNIVGRTAAWRIHTAGQSKLHLPVHKGSP